MYHNSNVISLFLLQMLDWSTAMPHAKNQEAPRGEFVEQRRPVDMCLCIIPFPPLPPLPSPSSPSIPAHVEDAVPWFGPNTYKALSIGMVILLIVGILAVVGGVAFLETQKKSKKHFF